MSDSKPIHVIVVSPTITPRDGGISTAHYNLFRALLHSVGFTAELIAYDDRSSSDSSAEMRRFSTPRALQRLLHWVGRRYVQRFEPTAQPRFVPGIFRCAIGARRAASAISRDRPDLILVPDNGVPLYWMRFHKNQKVVWCSHHNYSRFRDNPLLSEYSWADIDVARSMERTAMRKARAAVCPCGYMRDEFRRAYDSFQGPIWLAPNVIDRASIEHIIPFSFESLPGWPRQRRVVYIPSGGTPIKGQRYVGELIRRIASGSREDIGFFISGPGPSDVLFEIGRAGLRDRVYAPGLLSWQDNLSRVASCRLTVSPTLVENYSMAFLESMLLGVPVVSFNTGGTAEIVRHGIDGYLHAYPSVDQMADQAVSMLNDNAQLVEFSRCARERAFALTDPTEIAGLYRRMDEALSRSSPSPGDSATICNYSGR